MKNSKLNQDPSGFYTVQLSSSKLTLTISAECGSIFSGGSFAPDYNYFLDPPDGQSPSEDEWKLFFSEECSHQEEEYFIAGVKEYLRTPEQKKVLDDLDISLQDLLRGQYSGEDAQKAVAAIFSDWNTRLGYAAFGS